MNDDRLEDSPDIAIVGMAGRFPGANSVTDYWQNLKAGRESIRFFSADELLASGVDPELVARPDYVPAAPTLDGFDLFDAEFFGISPREARELDPQHRLFLETVYETLEDAACDPQRFDGRIGMYAGSAINSYFFNTPLASHFWQNYLPTLLATDKDFMVTRAAFKLNLTGPAVTVQTACSTSLVAVHLACQSLLNEECDLALAGGVSIRVPHHAGYLFVEGGVASPDGHCRPFDSKANGTIFGSGIGLVALKRIADATADRDHIYAVIKGSAINNDGSAKADYTAPSVRSQSSVISEALGVAGVDPKTIGYVEAHATGTFLGDPIELQALTQAYDGVMPGSCAIGSVKGNIGHLDAAAGIAGLIKASLCLSHRTLVPSINFETPNPEIGFERTPFQVNTTCRDFEGSGVLRAAVTSLGIGGTNAHVVLEQGPKVDTPGTDDNYALIPLSAKDGPTLERMAGRLAQHIEKSTQLDLRDMSFTLLEHRPQYPHRYVITASDRESAIHALTHKSRLSVNATATPNCPVVFMFSGQGAQYPDMCRGLYQSETVFRDAFTKCAELFRDHVDLEELLYSQSDTEGRRDRLNQTRFAQPALFAVEYALASYWRSQGVVPVAMIGHSIGEYTAACIAEVISLEEAAKIVIARAQSMQAMPEGSMLSLSVAANELQGLLHNGETIAAENAPGMFVVGGTTPAIESLKKRLDTNGVDSRLLHTSHAFHTAMMEPAARQFVDAFSGISLRPPRIPFVSNVSGQFITAEQCGDPKYWSSHIVSPVQFGRGVATLTEKYPDAVFLEVGPGNTLNALTSVQFPNAPVVNSARRPAEQIDDLAQVAHAAGYLWANGVPLNSNALLRTSERNKVSLPTYPFDRRRHWIDARPTHGTADAPADRKPFEKWFSTPAWFRKASASPDPQTFDVAIVFADEAGCGDRLIELLRANANRIVRVTAGAAYASMRTDDFEIRCDNDGDYLKLFEQIAPRASSRIRIVHLWQLDKPDYPTNCERTGFLSLLSLARTLDQQSLEAHITVVTPPVYDVIGNELLNPAAAMSIGACKIIPLENGRIQCDAVDVVPDEILADTASLQALAETVVRPAPETVSALRYGQLWQPGFRPISLDPRRKPGPNSIWAITGGLGGLGLSLADTLGREYGLRFVLIGRSPVPERASWPELLNELSEEDGQREKIEGLRKLEEHGIAFSAQMADVADADAICAAFAQGESELGGPIRGIIHAAGIADFAGLIQDRDTQATMDVLNPKVAGLMSLNKAAEGRSIDHIALFSSMATVSWASHVGQVGYVAANEFLDSSAAAMRRAGLPACAINWDGWTDVGMAVKSERKLAEAGSKTTMNKEGWISPVDGAHALIGILSSDYSRVVVSPLSLETRISETQETGSEPRAENAARSRVVAQLQDADAELQSENAEIYARLVLGDRLGIDSDALDMDTPIVGLGLDSLMAVALRNEIRSDLQVDVDLADLVGGMTASDLAGVIAERSTLRAGINPADSAFEGEI